jgi:S1-C subfamily serine protease
LLYRSLKNLSLFLAFAAWAFVGAQTRAQVSTPKPAAPAPPPAPVTLSVEPSSRQSQQIVTVVHRLNGIKALALLGRSGQTVAEVDENALTTPNAVTIITAGLVLSDGQNIVARLPQAEAEVESFLLPSQGPAGYYSLIPNQALTPRAAQELAAAASATIPAPRAIASPEASGFFVVQSNGRQFIARYIGLDGGSGLSLLQIPGLKAALSKDAAEEQLAVGQTVRIFAPERIEQAQSAASTKVALRVSELEAKITAIARTSTGKITNLTIRAQSLSPATAGGIALNEVGEAVGIIGTSSAGTARLIPVASVRRAAERVLARQTSVPRPWLGVRGEVVRAMPLEKIYSMGWPAPEAAALKGKLEGILLTSVAPGTPAALANLRPGDVITRVNDLEIKNGEDFSFVLNEAGSGATVNFTVYRWERPAGTPSVYVPAAPPAPVQTMPPAMPPGQTFAFDLKPFDVNIKLGESLNRLAEERKLVGTLRPLNPYPLVARGIETAALSAKAATHLGANGGIVVLYVDSDSLAARAGLKVFDVIETVEGKPVGKTPLYYNLPKGDLRQLRLGIVRDRKRMEITIARKDEPQK